MRSTQVHIEIAGDEHAMRTAIFPGVFNGLGKLQGPKMIVATAFQVEVVYRKPAAADFDLRHERDAPAQPRLKRLRPRQIPPRFPKVGLLTKTDDSGPLNRPAG